MATAALGAVATATLRVLSRVCVALPRQLRQPVSMADLQESVKRVNSSVGGQDLAKFAQWMEDYGAA
jgi:hypothetical protein